ncbi:50S ribosomal protein L19e [Candidatus Woesearchaeota archaeon]|nr:50S ribosomal protein L19e [Candidatus Woesearchaeota archaeon]
MKLTLQKRLAAKILKCSEKRVVFEPARLEDVKEAITKTDVRLLIGEGVIKEKPKQGVSRVRANKRRIQRRKGLRKGEGSRKGKVNARESKKQAWMKKIRAQRKFLKQLKKGALIKPRMYKKLYAKSKGGFFRNIKHIKLYIQENKLILKSEKENAVGNVKDAKKAKKAKNAKKIGKIKKT